jgi:hypothetical protein
MLSTQETPAFVPDCAFFVPVLKHPRRKDQCRVIGDADYGQYGMRA